MALDDEEPDAAGEGAGSLLQAVQDAGAGAPVRSGRIPLTGVQEDAGRCGDLGEGFAAVPYGDGEHARVAEQNHGRLQRDERWGREISRGPSAEGDGKHDAGGGDAYHLRRRGGVGPAAGGRSVPGALVGVAGVAVAVGEVLAVLDDGPIGVEEGVVADQQCRRAFGDVQQLCLLVGRDPSADEVLAFLPGSAGLLLDGLRGAADDPFGLEELGDLFAEVGLEPGGGG
ncbi:hypothetical protein M1P56_16695 [Streptomyces sp. HU2014]|uniref:hypothetical protein n=1 Tax=Streptomyces sp. HU2014 TaxID=2939414 RepID=UPI0020107632|nr:hypothetical protein [Streptomyces sp. HU2014]UQI49632.1 hypothetical protein M1P56_16695 [Streptomyces sp. HU2014]